MKSEKLVFVTSVCCPEATHRLIDILASTVSVVSASRREALPSAMGNERSSRASWSTLSGDHRDLFAAEAGTVTSKPPNHCWVTAISSPGSGEKVLFTTRAWSVRRYTSYLSASSYTTTPSLAIPQDAEDGLSYGSDRIRASAKKYEDPLQAGILIAIA